MEFVNRQLPDAALKKYLTKTKAAKKQKINANAYLYRMSGIPKTAMGSISADLKRFNLLKKTSPVNIHKYLEERAKLLPLEHKRFISPHLYKVGISKELMGIRNALTKQLRTLH